MKHNIRNNGPLLHVADMASSVTDLKEKHLVLEKSISVECTSEPVRTVSPRSHIRAPSRDKSPIPWPQEGLGVNLCVQLL